MVATVGSIQVLFDAQYGAAVQSLRRFASESDRTGTRVSGAVQKIDKAASAANRSIGQLNGSQFRTLTLSALRASNSVERLRGILLSTSSLLGGFSAAFAIRGLQEYSDTYRSLTNQIKVSIGEGQDLAKTQEDIFQTAQRSRAEYEATAKLFSRINTSAKKLNIAQRDSLRVTETIQKAFVLGGSTPTEAAQSSLQLSQGIASNKLGGDELRSVLENPALGQLLADKISDGDIGKLRELSEQGKLTAGVIVRAFLSASGEIDKMFESTEQTVGQAFQRIDNALLKYVGTNESVQSGMSATVALANSLADNIDTVADAIIFLGTAAAGVFGARKLSELSSYIAQVRVLRAEAILAARATQAAALASVQKAETSLVNAGLGVLATKNTGTPKQTDAATAKLTAAQKAYADATRVATIATAQLNTTIAAQRGVATAASLAMRGLGAAINFLGGPLGVALVALSGYIAYSTYQAEKAKAALDYYSTALDQTALAAAKTSTALETLGAVQERVANARNGGSSAQLQAIGETKSRIETLIGTFTDLSGAQIRNSGVSRTQAVEVMNLRKQFVDGKITVEGFQAALDAISADSASPAFAAIASGMITVAKSIAIARGELQALLSGFAQVQGGQLGKTDRPGVQVVPTDIKNKLAEDLRTSSQERIDALNEDRKVDPITARIYGLGTPTSKAPGAGGADKADPFGDAMKSTNEDIAALKAEAQVLQTINPLINDYGRSMAAAKEAQELLTAAQKGGQAVGKELTDVQQLLYGDISALSPAAQQQALAIRQLALAYGDAEAQVNKLKEAQENAKAAMEFGKELISSSLSTFRQSLMEGKSLWQALGDVALSVLDKIAAKLEEMIADQLIKSLFGGTSSTTGGFNIMSLFGLGGATAGFNPAGKVGLFASGTKSAPAGFQIVGEKGPEIIETNGGEKITPHYLARQELDRIASEGVGFQASPAEAAVGQASRFRNDPPNRIEVYMRKDGKLDAHIVGLSARTSVPLMEEGLRQFSGTELPGTIDGHMQTPRRRRVRAV